MELSRLEGVNQRLAPLSHVSPWQRTSVQLGEGVLEVGMTLDRYQWAGLLFILVCIRVQFLLCISSFCL
jgi:hypothetical protein